MNWKRPASKSSPMSIPSASAPRKSSCFPIRPARSIGTRRSDRNSEKRKRFAAAGERFISIFPGSQPAIPRAYRQPGRKLTTPSGMRWCLNPGSNIHCARIRDTGSRPERKGLSCPNSRRAAPMTKIALPILASGVRLKFRATDMAVQRSCAAYARIPELIHVEHLALIPSPLGCSALPCCLEFEGARDPPQSDKASGECTPLTERSQSVKDNTLDHSPHALGGGCFQDARRVSGNGLASYSDGSEPLEKPSGLPFCARPGSLCETVS